MLLGKIDTWPPSPIWTGDQDGFPRLVVTKERDGIGPSPQNIEEREVNTMHCKSNALGEAYCFLFVDMWEQLDMLSMCLAIV